MVKDKLTQIIKFLAESVDNLSGSLEDMIKELDTFNQSLKKVTKDLKKIKEVKESEGIVAETTESKVSAPLTGVSPEKATAREKAASVLLNMLSTSKAETPANPSAVGTFASAGTPSPAEPAKTPKAGPPASPPSSPPKSPPSGPPTSPPPSGSNLPPPPKLPPSGPSAPPSAPPTSNPPSGLPPPPKMPPSAPSGTSVAPPPGVTSPPTFAQRPSAPPGVAPGAAAAAGNAAGLGGLREEMLRELDRLKKIMRGT